MEGCAALQQQIFFSFFAPAGAQEVKMKWNRWESGSALLGLALTITGVLLHLAYDSLEGSSQETVWHNYTEPGVVPPLIGAVVIGFGLFKGDPGRRALLCAGLTSIGIMILVVGRGGPGWHFEEPAGSITLCVMAILGYTGACAACICSRIALELSLSHEL